MPARQHTSTRRGGIDLLAHIKEDEASEKKMFASIEVENEFESIEVHGHYPGQTSLVFCWKIVDQDILEKAVARYKYYKRVRMVGPRSNHGVIINFINKLKRDPKRLEILGNGTQKNPTSTSKTLSTQLST